MGRFDNALEAHERALCFYPNLFAAHVNRGNELLRRNRLTKGAASYVNALALQPENAEANFNLALTKLCLGELREGWRRYEYRWKRKALSQDRPDYPQPMWQGETDLQGKTIFLRAEQGLGDTLQFVRYAPLLQNAAPMSSSASTAAA